MQWKKLGIVFAPPSEIGLAASHAQVPTPLLLDETRLRVYYSSRDKKGRSRPFFVDFDPERPGKVLRYSTEPCLDIGRCGTFDDNGVLCCSIVRLPNGMFHMYYVGFELYANVRYKLFTGLAVSGDGEVFRRHSQTPVLDRSENELCFRGGPYVMLRDGVFHMYYVAGSDWEEIDGKSMPVYELKHMTSPDGIAWPDEGRVVLPISEADEHGFGRPWVVASDSGYEMFYSVRRRSFRAYRIGWAVSDDGLRFTRRDGEAGLDVTPGSFDDQAIMYAAVTSFRERTYCFYNGNDFGVDGIALAVKE